MDRICGNELRGADKKPVHKPYHQITLPNTIAVLVLGKADILISIEGNRDVKVPLERGIGLGRSGISTQNYCVYVFITNFRNEPQHFARRTVIARVDEITEASETLLLWPGIKTPETRQRLCGHNRPNAVFFQVGLSHDTIRGAAEESHRQQWYPKSMGNRTRTTTALIIP